jgi:hypothetical protein
VKNIAFVKTENALVLGDIQESDVIQVSKYFNNTLGMFQKISVQVGYGKQKHSKLMA